MPEGNHRGQAYAASRRRTSPRRAEILLGCKISIKTTLAPSMRNYKSDLTRHNVLLKRCHSIGADTAHTALTAVHGIGPWTADIYLLSCLGHAEAWPAGDLALQEAARLAFALPARPTAADMPCRNPGGRGALWRRECCGGIIARPRQQNPPPAERRN
jgi:hypothetical protein